MGCSLSMVLSWSYPIHAVNSRAHSVRSVDGGTDCCFFLLESSPPSVVRKHCPRHNILSVVLLRDNIYNNRYFALQY